MQIEFLKDHCNYKKGDFVDNHLNADYLIVLAVAKQNISGQNKELVKPKVEERKTLVGKINKVK